MADQLVGAPELARVRRHGQQHAPAGAKLLHPLMQRAKVVFDVLEHLERQQIIEGGIVQLRHFIDHPQGLAGIGEATADHT